MKTEIRGQMAVSCAILRKPAKGIMEDYAQKLHFQAFYRFMMIALFMLCFTSAIFSIFSDLIFYLLEKK